MQPVKISLNNFLSYGNAEVDFQGLSVVALLGNNGSGKSSLVDGLTFAIYGEGRYKDIDRYIRQGQEQAVSELQFALADEVYRVIRTRSNRGKGKSTLELAKQGCSGWISLSGATMKETQDKIRDLLRMDYETFVSSCIILQDEADRLTKATPGKRMEIFGQILGLDVYDKLQEAAKAKGRQYRDEAAIKRAAIDNIEADLSRYEDLKQQEQDLEGEQKALRKRLAQLEADLENQELIVSGLRVRAARSEDLKRRQAQINGDLSSLKDQLFTIEQKRGRLQQIIERGDEIRAKAAELEQVKQQITALKVKQPMLAEAKTEGGRLEAEQSRVEAGIGKLTAQIAAARAALADKDALEWAAADYQKAITELDGLDVLAEKWQALDAQAKEAHAAWGRAEAELAARIKALGKELADLEAKVAMLENSGCIDSERATCKFLADAQAAKARIPQVHIEQEALVPDAQAVPRLEQAWRDLEAKRDALGYDPKGRQRLKDYIAELRPKAERAGQLASRAEMLQSLQEQQRDAEERKAELAGRLQEVQKKAQELGSELVVLPAIEDRAKKLEQWAKVLPELNQAEETIKQLRSQADQLETRKAELLQELDKVNADLVAINQVAAELRATESALFGARQQLKEAQDQEQDTGIKLGTVRARLKDLDAKKQQKASLESELKGLIQEEHYYAQLTKAFGRSGIPALIIENALPEVESLANELLSRLTGGRMEVRFETQKEAKTTGNISETLDIIVSDELGERPYEGWSGAERFEVNLSIRLAISKFLAKRAGAKIELLVCDENASCLDNEGRQQFVEAINAIAEDFKLVIVITHISELQEAFPQQLIVSKTAEGSRVEVV